MAHELHQLSVLKLLSVDLRLRYNPWDTCCLAYDHTSRLVILSYYAISSLIDVISLFLILRSS